MNFYDLILQGIKNINSIEGVEKVEHMAAISYISKTITFDEFNKIATACRQIGLELENSIIPESDGFDWPEE